MKPLPIGRRLPGERFEAYVQRALEEIERSSFDLSQALPDVDPRSELYLRADGWAEVVGGGGASSQQKSIPILAPSASDDITFFYTPVGIRIVGIHAVVQGTTPSAIFTIRHAADRSATGTEVVTGGTVANNTTSGVTVTTFNAADIAPGWVWIETTAVSGTVAELSVTLWIIPATTTKSVSIPNPIVGEDLTLLFTPVPLTVTEIRSVLIGSSSPSVTFTIRFASNRTVAGTEVKTGGMTVTNTTAGLSVTTFDDATIPANSLIWLETSAKSGTVDQFHTTIVF